MLQNVCEHIHNYFIKDVLEGSFEIADAMISLPLIEGQRFLIRGSVLNDGMYTYHETWIGNDDDSEVVGLQAESFAGTISALAVPPAVIALAGEIKAWVDKFGDQVNSPYQSESVLGVYSYQLKGSAQSGGSQQPVTWQSIFADRLNRWRKVSFI